MAGSSEAGMEEGMNIYGIGMIGSEGRLICVCGGRGAERGRLIGGWDDYW